MPRHYLSLVEVEVEVTIVTVTPMEQQEQVDEMDDLEIIIIMHQEEEEVTGMEVPGVVMEEMGEDFIVMEVGIITIIKN